MLLLPRKRADDEVLPAKKYGHDSCAQPPHFVGGFAEYCYITPGTCVIKIPEGLTDEEAAPANCALATVVAGWEARMLESPQKARFCAAKLSGGRQ
jgi:D-arabinose 1-dehydrogenase-like Zn-dependent alcohol dehydrogenase